MVAFKTKNKYIFPSGVEYGNVIAERDGAKAENPQVYRPYYQDGDLYWTDYGFGVVRPNAVRPDDGIYQRNYRWNERNLLSESSDSVYTVHYRYGADGQRAIKYVSNSRLSTLYFNKMWQTNSLKTQSKHIFVGETRIATKHNTEGNNNTEAERRRIYYYHSDHLGSAQTITNYNQVIHERLEYTPYGELWIDWRSANSTDTTPFRFTGKELDKETGLYYYGARYLDPKISRWLGVDPAMGEYVPSTGQDPSRLGGQGGVFNYVNLHVYHYAGNNPVKYIDPDGREFVWEEPGLINKLQYDAVKAVFDDIIENDTTEVGDRFRELANSDKIIKIVVLGPHGDGGSVSPGLDGEQWSSKNKRNASNGTGTDATVYISSGTLKNNTTGEVLAHEIAGHAYDMAKGTYPGFSIDFPFLNRKGIRSEENAIAMENLYISTRGGEQRRTYETKWGNYPMPIYSNGGWTLKNRPWRYHH